MDGRPRRLLVGVYALPRPLPPFEDEISRILRRRVRGVGRAGAGGPITAGTKAARCCWIAVNVTLAAEFDAQKQTPFDAAQAIVVASKCLAAHFSEDSSAVSAIVASSERLQSQGGALVGLVSQWPDHEVVVREYQNLVERRGRSGLLVCAQLWLLSAQGTPRTGRHGPCSVRHAARVESMGFPGGCVGGIARATNARSQG